MWGATAGAGAQPSPCASPPGLPLLRPRPLTPLPSFADASFLTRGCSLGASAQRSAAPGCQLLSWLQLFCCGSSWRFKCHVTRGGRRSSGELSHHCPSKEGIPAGNWSCGLRFLCPLPARERAEPERCRPSPVAAALPLLPPGGCVLNRCGLGLGCKLMKEEVAVVSPAPAKMSPWEVPPEPWRGGGPLLLQRSWLLGSQSAFGPLSTPPGRSLPPKKVNSGGAAGPPRQSVLWEASQGRTWESRVT